MLGQGCPTHKPMIFVHFFSDHRDFLAHSLKRTMISSCSSVWEITLGARMAPSTLTLLSHLEGMNGKEPQQAVKILPMADVSADW